MQEFFGLGKQAKTAFGMRDDGDQRQQPKRRGQARHHDAQPTQQARPQIGPQRVSPAVLALARISAGKSAGCQPHQADRHKGDNQPVGSECRKRRQGEGKKGGDVKGDGDQQQKVQGGMVTAKGRAAKDIAQNDVRSDRKRPAAGPAPVAGWDEKMGPQKPDQNRAEGAADDRAKRHRHAGATGKGAAFQHQRLPQFLGDEEQEQRHQPVGHGSDRGDDGRRQTGPDRRIRDGDAIFDGVVIGRGAQIDPKRGDAHSGGQSRGKMPDKGRDAIHRTTRRQVSLGDSGAVRCGQRRGRNELGVLPGCKGWGLCRHVGHCQLRGMA